MRSAPTPALARLEAAYTASSSSTLPGPGRALLESAELQGDEYGCSEERHDRRDLLEPKPRGVNLGGWLVLEPWVTPSLFYQFEGRPANETAMDMHGFCRVLGAQEANRQLRIHWEKWVTEEHLAELASRGINALRVPVGDWMWTPYWPYHGCADGAVDQLSACCATARSSASASSSTSTVRASCAPAPRADAPLARACRAMDICPRSPSRARSLARRRAALSERLRQQRAGGERDVAARRPVVCALAVPECGVAGHLRPADDDLLVDLVGQHPHSSTCCR